MLIHTKSCRTTFNKYIRATTYDKGRKKEGLYKINIVNDVDPTTGNYGIVLTPLTRLLPNENSEWSSREKYNVGALSQEGYKYLLYTRPLNYHAGNRYGYGSENSSEAQNIYRANHNNRTLRDDLGYNPRNDTKEKMAVKFDIHELAADKGENGPTGRAIKTIQRYYTENHSAEYEGIHNLKIYFVDNELGDYIKNYGDYNGSVQTIEIPVTSQTEDGKEVVNIEPHKFLITKVDNKKAVFTYDPWKKGTDNSLLSVKDALTSTSLEQLVNLIDWNNATAIKKMFIDKMKVKSTDDNIAHVIRASNMADQQVLTTLAEMTKNKSLLEVVAMGRRLGVTEFKNLYAAREVTDDYDPAVNY